FNGQPRPVSVRDSSIAAVSTAARRADPGDRAQIPAGLPGLVTYAVAVGDRVVRGDRLATIEAMKMEAAVTSPHDGTVAELVRASGASVEVGDLLLIVTPDPASS
uniref:biotin/lipoyl-containing protein n=1 Tax=Frankia sp. Cppng1_Ct_nod TaxID=2897162 RepID=UPI0024E0773A